MVKIILRKFSLSPVMYEIPNPIIYASIFISSYLTIELFSWIIKKLIRNFKRLRTEKVQSLENLRSADPTHYNDPTKIKRGGAVDCISPDTSWLVISEQLIKKLTEILNPAIINPNGTTIISPGVFFLAFTIVNNLEFGEKIGQIAQTIGFNIANISVEVAVEELKKAGLSGIGGLVLGFLLVLAGPNMLAARFAIAVVAFGGGSIGVYQFQKMVEDITCIPIGIVRELPASKNPDNSDSNPIFSAPKPLDNGIKQFVIKGQESHNLYEENEVEISCIPEFEQSQDDSTCVGDLDNPSCNSNNLASSTRSSLFKKTTISGTPSEKSQLKEKCTVRRISLPLSQRTATIQDIVKEDGTDIREETEKYIEAYEEKIQKYNKQEADAAEKLKNRRIQIMESYTPSRKPTLQTVDEAYEENFLE